MKKTFVNELKEGSIVTGPFLCTHKSLLFGKNNKSYINLKLADKTGMIETRIWENAETLSSNFDKNDYVQIEGKVVYYQDHLQLNVFEIQKLDPTQFSPSDYLPSSTKDIPQMYRELLELCQQEMKNVWIKQLILAILEDPQYQAPFQKAPAAKTNHHAWIGGLLEHVLGLCKLAKSVLVHYPQINPDLVYAGLIMHDFGKVEEMDADRSFEYTDKGRLIGHLIIGVEILIKKAAEIPNFPPKILEHIEHIVLSHHGRLEYGSPKRPKTLEAIVVHYLDDMDSKIQGFIDLVAREKGDGDWTSHNNRLFERPLYKNTQRDLEGLSPTSKEQKEHVVATPKAKEESKKNSKKPLTSSLGEILQQSITEKNHS